MIDKMDKDKKIFAIWIGIFILVVSIFSYIHESNTSKTIAYENCLAVNKIRIDESAMEKCEDILGSSN
jgi:hypothetical protein|tara:strand:- start:237 stop:440 length:204 start_codon:yes stop_codon:yes gene_type:complete